MPRLNIDTDEKVELSSENLIGVSTAILGITGSGKSNTAAVLIEEGLSNGLPMTIIDTDGEHWGLKERCEPSEASMRSAPLTAADTAGGSESVNT